MAGRLSNAASRLFGGGGGIARSVAFSLPTRSGMGLPVGKHLVPDKPLPEQDELVWDNGTPFPEPCIDRLAPTIGKYEALAWLCGGLGFFASIGLLAVWNDKASKIPFALSGLFQLMATPPLDGYPVFECCWAVPCCCSHPASCFEVPSYLGHQREV